MHSIRRLLVLLAMILAVSTVNSQQTIAQQPAPTAAPSNSTPATRPMNMEFFVVALLIGGAIYAVCRSSRRM